MNAQNREQWIRFKMKNTEREIQGVDVKPMDIFQGLIFDDCWYQITGA